MDDSLNTIILILSSGFVGAIAGGGISLLSQVLNRKWQKEDELVLVKREIYGEIIAIGSHYIGYERFAKINHDVAKALLFSGPELSKKLVSYIVAVETLNKAIRDNKNEKEIEKIKSETTKKTVQIHKDMIEMMKQELGINKNRN